MVEKLGVVWTDCYGGKRLSICIPPKTTSFALPDCFKHIRDGMIAYIDNEGKLAFVEEE